MRPWWSLATVLWGIAFGGALVACGLFTRTVEVPTVIERVKQCATAPPPGEVPLVDGGKEACPEGYDFCMTAAGSAALAKLYLWASGVWLKCGPEPAAADAGP